MKHDSKQSKGYKTQPSPEARGNWYSFVCIEGDHHECLGCKGCKCHKIAAEAISMLKATRPAIHKTGSPGQRHLRASLGAVALLLMLGCAQGEFVGVRAIHPDTECSWPEDADGPEDYDCDKPVEAVYGRKPL